MNSAQSSSSKESISTLVDKNQMKVIPKTELYIHSECPIGCYAQSDSKSVTSGKIQVNSDVAIESASSETKAIRHRMPLCWLTLSIPLFLYLKFTFWDKH